jgi:phosphate/sulfate permease
MEQNMNAEKRTEKKVDWGRKLTSRKLWTAVVGIVVGLAAAFGLPENDIAQIAGIVTSAMSVVAYITGEAKVDAAQARARETATLFGDTAGSQE